MKFKFLHYNESDPLNGIFAFLNKNFSTFFEIEASNRDSGVFAREITKRDHDESYSYWATNSDPEMIITFNHPILLTSYTIENAKSHTWMMNWTLFGSNNKKQWEILDKRKGEMFYDHYTSDIYGLYCPVNTNKSYFVENPKIFSHFKIRNDYNSCNNVYIIM